MNETQTNQPDTQLPSEVDSRDVLQEMKQNLTDINEEPPSVTENELHPDKSDPTSNDTSDVLSEDDSRPSDGTQNGLSLETDALSPDDLVKHGQTFIKKGMYDEAVDALSEAVQRKLLELGGEEYETDTQMAQYYLNYG